MICIKNLTFSSHPRGKVRRQGPPSSTRAQPWRTKGYGVTNQRLPLCQEAYTRHTGNYIICNFIYSFIYLFNHFQQKNKAWIQVCPCRWPTQSMRGWPHHWGLLPLLFSNSGVGSFTCPKEPDRWKCCETGTMVYRPYLRRLESITVCRSHCKGSTFSSVILKTLSVGPAGFGTHNLPLSRPTLFQLS